MDSFIKIGTFVWALEITQTHRQTDTQSDTLASIVTYSVKWTEYKNEGRYGTSVHVCRSTKKIAMHGAFQDKFVVHDAI